MNNNKVTILSPENIVEGHVVIDNVFLASYMPNADSDHVKVYLYGLFIASSGEEADEKDFIRALNLSIEKIVEAFLYWEEFGFVTILKTDPLQVSYSPMRPYLQARKYKPSEFKDFNKAIQEILHTKMLLPNEYNELYRIIKEWRMSAEALIMVAAYCVKTYLFPSEKNSGVQYVIQVARDWAKKGIKTVSDVDEHIDLLQSKSVELTDVFKALKLKKPSQAEDKQLYIKWTKELNFPHASIIHTAKKLSKNKNSTLQKLDERLEELYKLNITTLIAIDEFESQKTELFNLAKETTRILGLYIENLSYFIETYFTVWLNLGFSKDTILRVARDCSKAGIRNLEGLNSILTKFYKKGLVSENAIENHYGSLTQLDGQIREVLTLLDINRNITNADRNFYNQWTTAWQLTHKFIANAALCAKGKGNPMAYMNAILAEYFAKGIKTVEQLQASVDNIKEYPVKNADQLPARKKETQIIRHEYTKEQLQSMLLEDIETFKL